MYPHYFLILGESNKDGKIKTPLKNVSLLLTNTIYPVLPKHASFRKIWNEINTKPIVKIYIHVFITIKTIQSTVFHDFHYFDNVTLDVSPHCNFVIRDYI